MIMKERVLVVEDEKTLQETLVYNLEHQGYEVLATGNGDSAVTIARQFKPDLILLDIMLPGMDGFEVCRTVRQEMNMPILFLTARDDEIDRVVGLEIGGDDFISKPFSMRELLARVKARLRMTRLLRQSGLPAQPDDLPLQPEQAQQPNAGSANSSARGAGANTAEARTFGNLAVLEKRREIYIDSRLLTLKPKEYELMLFFTQNCGRVITREYILKNVWDYSFTGDSRTVDVHVRWLREKIEADPAHPARIITVRGGGYRFDG
jgi:DNA-binding response OmpR family regulator